MNVADIQKRQEAQYHFPYHYIPYIEGNKFSQSKTLKWGYEYLSYIYFVINKISSLHFNTLLDVGCGDGRFLHELNKKFTDKHLYGIDTSKRAISFAKLINTKKIDFICNDITNQNILQYKFDIITLIETLEHIEPNKIDNFLYNIKLRLSETGFFILTVPSNNLPLIDKHYQHFDMNSLEKIIQPYFKIKEYYFLNKKSKLDKKVLRKIFVNNIFVLNQERLMFLLYKIYCHCFLNANEKNAKRIALICTHK